jgi:hypothetical protein
VLGFGNTLTGGAMNPLELLFWVSLHSQGTGVIETDKELCLGKALLGGFAVPLGGFAEAFWDYFTRGVHRSQLKLRLGVALFGPDPGLIEQFFFGSSGLGGNGKGYAEGQQAEERDHTILLHSFRLD